MEPDNRTIFESYYGENFVFPFASVTGAKTPLTGIVYTTTNSAVADVTEIGGIVLLGPGTAEIVATFPDDGNFQVRLPVTVENRYAWSYWWSEEPLSVAVGESKTNFISQRSWSSQENSVLSASWSSSDPSVATVEAETPSTFWCSVTGVSAGSATITGVFTINSWTNVGMRPMTATASFQVTVS